MSVYSVYETYFKYFRPAGIHISPLLLLKLLPIPFASCIWIFKNDIQIEAMDFFIDYKNKLYLTCRIHFMKILHTKIIELGQA